MAQVGVAGVAGFDGGDFAIAEQAQKIAQPSAGERHAMRGEEQLQPILRRVGFVF
jgi:hypothetical protein